jgi:hypothetical protein
MGSAPGETPQGNGEDRMLFAVNCMLVIVMLAALAAAIWYLSRVVEGLVRLFRVPSRPRYVLDLSGRAPWLK